MLTLLKRSYSFKHTNMKKVVIALFSILLVQQANAQSDCIKNFKPEISYYKDGLAWIEPYAWKDVPVSIADAGGMPVVSLQDMQGVLKVAYNSSQRCYDAHCIKELLGVDGWAGSEWSLIIFDDDDYNYMQDVTSTGQALSNAELNMKYKIDDVNVNHMGGKIAFNELHLQVRKNTIDKAHRRALKMCN